VTGSAPLSWCGVLLSGRISLLKSCRHYLEEKAAYFYSYFYEDTTSKAEFAQTLASILSEKYKGKPLELLVKLPKYLVDAIKHVAGS
jgi:hypothetical protein